jgi:hypothetical protein
MVKHNPVRARRSRSNWCFMVSVIVVTFIARPVLVGKATRRVILKNMKVLILYRPNSEHSRLIEEFVHEYESRHQSDHLELLNIDTREGSATATLYDIVQYPAIMVMHGDGHIQKIWQGDSLPRLDEVASYARA